MVDCDALMMAIDVGKARRLLEKNDIYPESCFLDEMVRAADAAIDEGLTDGKIAIPRQRCWFSGNHVDETSVALVAPMIVGRLSGYFVGEDGGLHGGFEIEGGRLRKCDVSATLTPVASGVHGDLHARMGDGMTPSGCPQCAEMGRVRDKEELGLLRDEVAALRVENSAMGTWLDKISGAAFFGETAPPDSTMKFTITLTAAEWRTMRLLVDAGAENRTRKA